MHKIARSFALALSMSLASMAAAGCGGTISGRAEPASTPPSAVDTPSGQTEELPRSSVLAEAPRIPRPRTIEGIDPCGLLAPRELAAVGGAIGPPHRDRPLPGSCTNLVGGGPEDSAGAGFHIPYREAVAKQPRGVAVDVDGHSAWLYCETIDAYQTCTAVTAIHGDASLLTMLSKRDTTAADTTDMLFGLTRAALGKLPAG
ncbi:DUF3558 family protein [Parasphingorhabdus pacifica]